MDLIGLMISLDKETMTDKDMEEYFECGVKFYKNIDCVKLDGFFTREEILLIGEYLCLKKRIAEKRPI
jgi:hypothetical protein